MRKLLLSSFGVFVLLFGSYTVQAEDEETVENEKTDITETDEKTLIDKMIKELESKVEEIEDVKREFQEELYQINDNMTDLEKDIVEIKNNIIVTEGEIEKLDNRIEQLNEDIATKEIEIEEKNKELDEQKEKLGKTLSFLYENRNISIFDFIFGSENLSQVLNSYDFIRTIADENETIHQRIQVEEKELQKKRENLEKDKVEIAEAKEEQEVLRKQQVKEQNELEELMIEFEAEEADVIKRIEKEDQAQQEAMAAITKHIQEKEAIAKREAEEERKRKEEERRKREAEERKKALEAETEYIEKNNGIEINLGESGLQNPMLVGSYRFTSNYGYRTHPVAGVRRHHNGVDLAAPVGTPIYAAGDGVILFSGPAPGFGNWIVIAHDNGLYTIYGHMYSNNMYVSEGDYVLAGDHIAGVGSAGTSTGPHLHFEVASGYNGERFNYIDPLTVVNIKR